MKRYHIEGWNEADGTPVDRVMEIDDEESIEDVLSRTDLNVDFDALTPFKNTETIESVEAAANEMLKGTNLVACVVDTEEDYEADLDDPEDIGYDNAPMYEAHIENAEGDIVSETTGRYCDLSSVKDELLGFTDELASERGIKITEEAPASKVSEDKEPPTYTRVPKMRM